jgi:hypothetical protein
MSRDSFTLRLRPFLAAALLAACVPLRADEALEPRPDSPFFAKFKPLRAPVTRGLLLRENDRLAICGDSITEQKMYSRALETYLTVCMPQLNISVRQYGWGGETAEGFLRRMTNDCLRFKPTVATTCYGMNDHRYTAYSEANAAWYVANQRGIVDAFKAAGARVVLGSPGCVGAKVPWAKGTSEEMNLNLCELRNHDIRLATEEGVSFADVFWPMFTAGWTANQRHGAGYNIAGGDGVHPGWSGSFIMAYAFLKALGLDGDLGTLTLDLASGKAEATGGHDVVSGSEGQATFRSHRYPFCAPPGEVAKDDNIRSAWSLVPFQQELNRLTLVVRGATAANYKLTWGGETRTLPGSRLGAGINLAAEFTQTPFADAFRKVDEAVGRKQAYETKQVKTLFHGEEGRADMEATVAVSEKARKQLVDTVLATRIPVTHTLKVEAVKE